MRHFLVIFTVIVAAFIAVSSSPIDLERRLVNRPSPRDIFTRVRRAEPYAKGRPAIPGPNVGRGQPLELTLRKGEYMCGNKVCKLKPGEKPPCPGCQYPIY